MKCCRIACPFRSLLTLALVMTTCYESFAQEKFPTSRELKKLSGGELLDIEVTSVSRYPEKLTEVASAIQVLSNEVIRRGGYTYFDKSVWNKPGHTFDPSHAGYDPNHQILLQAMADLPGNFQVDVIARYVDSLPESQSGDIPEVPDYFNFNMRLAWMSRKLELSLCGQNLAGAANQEYGTNKIPRNIYGKVALRL